MDDPARYLANRRSGVITRRATNAEKAEAWNRLMESTSPDTVTALTEAWSWLVSAITERERNENV